MNKVIEYEPIIYIFIAVLFIVSVVYFGKQTITISSSFQCTESAIVNGVAECVKYEKKEEE